MTTLYPTHQCFNDAIELLDALMGAGADPLQLRLVHAICEAPDGHHYAHGWIEDVEDGTAMWKALLDGIAINVCADAAEHRASMKILESISYEMTEVYRLNVESGHFGPWIEKYREACGGTGEWPAAEAESA